MDAVVADCRVAWSPIFDLVHSVRRLNPTCAFCLFSNEVDRPADADCVGHGIDANRAKTSEGFLDLPHTIKQCIAVNTDLERRTRLPLPHAMPDLFPLPAFLLSGQGVILAANPAFERSLKLARYQFAHGRLDALLVREGERSQWQRLLDGPWEADAARALKLEFTCGDGRARPIRVVLKSNGVDAGVPAFLGGVLFDEAVFAHEPVVVAGAPAGESQDSARLPLAQLLSHDLQQPLQNVIRHAKWLLEHDRHTMSTEAVDTATHILNSASRMQEMVDGALMLTRIDAQRAPRGMVDLSAAVREAIDNLKIAIEDASATVESGPLPHVWGNHSQLVQLFQNLISNAVKFRNERLPRVRISAAERDGHPQVRVEDNGIGIRREDAADIFDLFKRLHAHEEYPGTGIGLAICKRIVDSHGGRIWVESTPGLGSTFIVEFPVTQGTGPGPSAR